MATTLRTNEVFLDTAYAIALYSVEDTHHKKALDLAEQLHADKTRFVTTRAVLVEIGNGFANLRYRKEAVTILDTLERDPLVLKIQLSEELYRKAMKLYRERPDKEWGMTD